MRRWLPRLALMLLCSPAFAVPLDAVEVTARNENDHVVLTAHFFAPVSRETAWGVLVDFEHMTSFLPYLKESRVLVRNGNLLRVQQKGVVPVAFLQISYTSIRDVELFPISEIRSTSVGGDSGLTRSTSRLLGANDRAEVSYRADWWPTSQMVAGFGMDTTRDLLQRQFTAMQQEMVRRQQPPK